MLRDTLKSESYFSTYFTEEDKRIAKFQTTLDGLPADKEKQRVQICRYLANFYRNYVTALYSSGASKKDIMAAFDKYLDYLKISKVSDYAETIDVLSLAVLMKKDYKGIKAVLNDDFNDPLTCSLMEQLQNGSFKADKQKLKFPEEYGRLWDFLVSSSKEAVSDLIAYMNTEWYESCKEMYWYDTHKSKENVYVGYWCWLAGAIAKINGISAAQLQTCKYIPCDLI